MTNSHKKLGAYPSLPGWLHCVGTIVGIVGGFFGLVGGGPVLYDNIFPPTLDVLEVVPICVYSGQNPQKWLGEGISFVAHVRGSRGHASIGGAELKSKIYLSVGEHLVFLEDKAQGRTLEGISAEVKSQRPYFAVAWNAWPEKERR